MNKKLADLISRYKRLLECDPDDVNTLEPISEQINSEIEKELKDIKVVFKGELSLLDVVRNNDWGYEFITDSFFEIDSYPDSVENLVVKDFKEYSIDYSIDVPYYIKTSLVLKDGTEIKNDQ